MRKTKLKKVTESNWWAAKCFNSRFGQEPKRWETTSMFLRKHLLSRGKYKSGEADMSLVGLKSSIVRELKDKSSMCTEDGAGEVGKCTNMQGMVTRFHSKFNENLSMISCKVLDMICFRFKK